MFVEQTTAAHEETVRVAKETVRLVGFGLGNLMRRIYLGDVDKADWTDADRENAKGTKVFLLGGSICTLGYTAQLLPLIAQRQISLVDPVLAGKVKIFTPHMESAHAGAFGAYYLALPPEAKKKVKHLAEQIYSRHKVPVLPLLDVGGTKVSLVLAHLNQEGDLTLDLLQSHRFATPISEPEIFYARLGALLAAPFANITGDKLFELIPVLAVGQPGRFDDPKGVIGSGTAKDLGPNFAGCNPSQLLTDVLAEQIRDIDVYCANDGRCQFLGIGVLSKARDPGRWLQLCEEKVAYLGLGTGLGAGFGRIDQNGYVQPFLMHNAFDIVATESHEELPFSRYLGAPFIRKGYSYGDLLSGKFFRKLMLQVDLDRLNSGQQPFFLPRSSAKHLLKVKEQACNLLASDERNSPLSAVLINEILADEIVTAKTEEIVDRWSPDLKKTVSSTMLTIAKELDETLLNNVRRCDYEAVIDQVERVKRRGRRVQFIGIGKSHSIGSNLAYVFRNLGIDSESCELTGANSENLTNLREDDLVFLISNSGRAAELLELIPYIHRKNCRTVALTGDECSPLADMCSYFVNTHVTCNPHPVAEAPTTSTTAALAAGTAIGMVVSYLFDYHAHEFYNDHPNLKFKVDFPRLGVRADPAFDRLAKVEDIFRRFADSIRGSLGGAGNDFVPAVIALTKRMLVSHYNGRTMFFTGAGTSMRVAEKIAATLTSIGIDASAVNSAQLPHGDFAHIRRGDLLVFISFSGETRHLLRIREVARRKQVDCATITANRNSKLARQSHPDLCLIAGEGALDTDLVAIPDQKILSSFINLTVGDVLAVILGQILGTTSKDFADEAHCGGVFARSDGRLSEDLLNRLGKDLVEYIGSDPVQLASINQNLAVPIDVEHLRSFERRSSGGFAEVPEVMIFGMGGIGLAYLAPIFSAYRNRIWFVESNQQRIEAMRQVQFQYVIHRAGGDEVLDSTIGRVSVIPSTDVNSITANALRVDTILTAVGVANIESLLPTLADIVKLRYEFRIEAYLHVVFSENFPVEADPLAHYRHRLREMLDTPELKVYFDGFVGLAPGIDEAVVPEVSLEALRQPINVETESAVLFIDRATWCGPWRRSGRPQTPNLGSSVTFTDWFLPLHMRKLWVHNMAHALIGYLGYYAGHENVTDAVADPNIEKIARSTMRKVAEELYRRWSYRETTERTVDDYVNWRWCRYQNEALNDKIMRLCRDPERKLKPEDRLIGPANYVRRYAPRTFATDDSIVDILVGVAAAMRYAVEHNNANAAALRAQVLMDLIDIDSSLLSRAEAKFQAFCDASLFSEDDAGNRRQRVGNSNRRLTTGSEN